MVVGGYCFSRPIGTENDIVYCLLGIILFVSGLPCLIGALVCLGSGLQELDVLKKRKEVKFPLSNLWKPIYCLTSPVVVIMFVIFIFGSFTRRASSLNLRIMYTELWYRTLGQLNWITRMLNVPKLL